MEPPREVGTLWIGGCLSWLEQICLKSFLDKGQKLTLFSYEDIGNVPDGVIRRDGREIIDTDDFIKYEQKNRYEIENLKEEFCRRIKTQTVLPWYETVPMLLWALLASGQIQMRKVDSWQTLAQPVEPTSLDFAA